MANHKSKVNKTVNSVEQPGCVVFKNGRYAVPFNEVDGKPIAAGIQNAVVGDVSRTPEEEKTKIHEYHGHREEVKAGYPKPPAEPSVVKLDPKKEEKK